MPRRRLKPPQIHGASPRLQADVDRLERSRNYLGAVARALPRKSARELRRRLDELDARY